MPPFIDLTGLIFGRWTVIRRTSDTAYKHPRWVCRCECGTLGIVKGQGLREGTSKSCGCYNSDVHRQICIERNTTHGQSKTRTHGIWVNMRQRCMNPINPKWPNYGGRGIKVCERWESYDNFLSDMGECPDGLTIDRENNDGDYGPGNCRWATQEAQQNNRGNNHLLTFGGETLTISEWAERTGINHSTIRMRVNDYGWSVERALTAIPVRRRP